MRRLFASVALALCLATAPEAQDDTSRRFAEIVALTNKGALAAALERASRLAADLSGPSDGPDIYVAAVEASLSRIKRLLGDGEAALRHADAAVARIGASPFAETDVEAAYRLERAKLLVSFGRLEAAEADLSAALRHFSDRTEVAVAVLDAKRTLAIVAAEQGRREAARDLFGEIVAEWRQRDDPARLADALLSLAGAELRLDRFAEAERAVAEARTLSPRDDAATAAAVDAVLGELALARSDLLGAEVLLARASARAADDPTKRGHALVAQATAANLRGDAPSADRLFREAISALSTTLQPSHPVIGRALVGLALANVELGRAGFASALMRRAIRLFEEAGRGNRGPEAEARVEFAMMLRAFGDSESALSQADAAIAILARDSETKPLRRAYADSARAFALADLGRLEEAAESFSAAIAAMETARGVANADLAPGLIRSAEVLAARARETGDAALAAAARDRLAAARVALSRTAAVGFRLDGAASAAEIRVLLAEGEPARAAALARRLLSQSRADAARDHSPCDHARSSQRAARSLAASILEALGPLVLLHGDRAIAASVFEAAQLPHMTDTAAALAAAAQRRSSVGPFAPLRDERRRLSAERCALAEAALRADAGLAPTGPSRQVREARVAAIDARVEEITAALRAEGAAVGERATEVAELADVEAALRDGEALLVQVTEEARTHLFLVDADGLRYAATDLGAHELRRRASRLRDAVSLQPPRRFEDLPPFPVDDALALYEGVFAPFAREIAGLKALFFVPDASMQAIPPAMLIRSPPNAPWNSARDEVLTGLDWLGDGAPISILPAPRALVALRALGETMPWKGRFVGVGDPDFAPQAVDWQAEIEALLAGAGAAGQSPVALLRGLPPLEGASEELTALARVFGDGPENVALGPTATEAWVRQSRAFAEADVVAFATHGLLARELGRFSEPALVLTPPHAPNDTDDGLLSASEIAAMSLTAGWVILSACNTAGADGALGEGLSGLASAFFEAGATSLTVSHWYVPSGSAGALTTFAASALRTGVATTQAQALQHAMARVRSGESLGDSRDPKHAHPVFWAPFVAVSAW